MENNNFEEMYRLKKTDFKSIFMKIYEIRLIVLISVLVFLFFTVLYNKYATPVFKNTTALLIWDQANNTFMTDNSQPSNGFGLFAQKKIENEIEILKSFSLVNSTVNQLNIQTSYCYDKYLFGSRWFKHFPLKTTREIYNDSPIRVTINTTYSQPVYVKFYVYIVSPLTFRIQAIADKAWKYNYFDNKPDETLVSFKLDTLMHFGQELRTKNFCFTVNLQPNKKSSPSNDYYFEFNNLEVLTNYLMSNLKIENSTKNSSAVYITLGGGNFKKITDFLNKYTEVYLEQNLSKKNSIANKTVEFIESQISDVSDSLKYSEMRLQNYRTSKNAVNTNFQGEQLYEKINSLESERAKLTVQLRYFNYIKDYFQSNNDVSSLVAPSSMEIQDPILSGLINQLIKLNEDRVGLLNNNKNPKNLYLNNLELQINNLKSTIQENVNNNINASMMALNDLDTRISRQTGAIQHLPKTERVLFGMERNFKLNDAIYTMLLQKRAEAQIARASNSPDYEIIDSARTVNSLPIAPRKRLNYMIALLLGFLLPSIYVLIKEAFNTKITDRKDLEHLSNLPVLGHIYHNNKKTAMVITDYPRSSISESFRIVRTNLQIFLQEKPKQIITITSSSRGEGKTFVSINIALAFAAFGKKTVLVGFDLRRPAIFQDLGLQNEVGVSSYLTDKSTLNEIIQKTRAENLDFIAAGPIPPNPVEVIASGKTNEFIQILKKQYDLIVIDSAPIGVIADTFLLMNYADMNIFLVRQNYTLREALVSTLNNLKINNYNNLSLILNDVSIKDHYSYQYGYDSRYYVE